MNSNKKALALGACAYAMWGILPLYWTLFRDMDPVFIFLNRCIWILPFVFLFMIIQRNVKESAQLFVKKESILRTVACAALIGANWLIYIKGVQEHRVIELGLGYFISPVLSVMFGVMFEGERLSIRRIAAVGLMALGAAIYGQKIDGVPLYAVGVAATFAVYGLLRKRQPGGAIAGQGAEALILATGCLMWLATGSIPNVGFDGSSLSCVLLVSTGIATALPLILFSAAAKRLEVSTLGMLTYINPTIKILVATIFLHEPFGMADVATLAVIWLGLGFYLPECRVEPRWSPR